MQPVEHIHRSFNLTFSFKSAVELLRKSHIFGLQFFWGAVAAATLCQSGSDFRRLAETNFWCYKIDTNSTTETFNGLELSESVLARDWNSAEEDANWADL